MQTHEVLTVPEVAEILKVDSVTVQRLLRAGRLRGNKVGRAWRMLRSDVLDHVNCYAAEAERATRFMAERYGDVSVQEQIARAIKETELELQRAN